VRTDDLRLLFRREPPPVLRLHLSSGMIFEIADPDVIVLTNSTVEIPLARTGGQSREAVISLLHIVWIEVVSRD
jgi:hypothetical protein